MELMIVLAILGILLGLVVPNYSTIVAERSVTSETKRIISALKLARSESRARGATVTVSRPSGGEWTDELEIYESTTAAGNVAYVAPTGVVGDDLIKRHPRISRKVSSRDDATNDGEFISFNLRGWLSDGETRAILIAVCSPVLDVSDGNYIEINRVGKIRERKIGNDTGGCL